MKKVNVPAGQSGDWEVESFQIGEEDASSHNLRCAVNVRDHGREIESGTYTRLVRQGTIVMSDTPAEMLDHEYFVSDAFGHVLIAGLGLGMVVQALNENDNVTAINVVEKSADVIALVGAAAETASTKPLTIINADIFDWEVPEGSKFEVAWFDIWDDICTDNRDDFSKLTDKFSDIVDHMGFWSLESLHYREPVFEPFINHIVGWNMDPDMWGNED